MPERRTSARLADGPCQAGGLAIDAKGLSKQFGQRKALDGVSFELPEGAFLSIFGPNGAGKTTLLRVLATLARPTDGSAHVLGFDLKERPNDIRANIGLIGHSPMLYPDLTAEENLLFYAELYGVPNPQQRVRDALESVELRARRIDPVRTFSCGMTQRLAIARALIHDPRLVFLDEPYSGLDPHAAEVLDQLIARKREGRTFVMVSHDLQRGHAMCTHVLVMARGRVVEFGEKAQVGSGFTGFQRVCADVLGTEVG